MNIGGGSPVDPFALPAAIPESQRALATAITLEQVAWPFTALVAGEAEDFSDRWAGWFAAAVNGELTRPSTMPERDPQTPGAGAAERRALASSVEETT
jgi:serine/threonine-protein kinase